MLQSDFGIFFTFSAPKKCHPFVSMAIHRFTEKLIVVVKAVVFPETGYPKHCKFHTLVRGNTDFDQYPPTEAYTLPK
jgi:hypothetical protein